MWVFSAFFSSSMIFNCGQNKTFSGCHLGLRRTVINIFLTTDRFILKIINRLTMKTRTNYSTGTLFHQVSLPFHILEKNCLYWSKSSMVFAPVIKHIKQQSALLRCCVPGKQQQAQWILLTADYYILQEDLCGLKWSIEEQSAVWRNNFVPLQQS